MVNFFGGKSNIHDKFYAYKYSEFIVHLRLFAHVFIYLVLICYRIIIKTHVSVPTYVFYMYKFIRGELNIYNIYYAYYLSNILFTVH